MIPKSVQRSSEKIILKQEAKAGCDRIDAADIGQALGFSGLSPAGYHPDDYSASNAAQASTCDGSVVRAKNSGSGSTSACRHRSARAIRLTSSPTGRALSRNATASSFEPMRPVIQLYQNRPG